MKTKSLVIGSAVAFAAATGAAQAADTVVFNAAPEPVNYVRVCDVYGAGFFYIPGTETCLKIGGYVWYQVGAASNGGTPAYNWPSAAGASRRAPVWTSTPVRRRHGAPCAPSCVSRALGSQRRRQ